MLRIQHYRKAYGDTEVLRIEDLQLAQGIYWLKGDNGSGKTTLLKSIAGLIPFEGEIEVQGTCLRKQRRLYTQMVSFAEAEPVYPGFLTGNELLQFYRQTKGGDSRKLEQMAEVLGVPSYLPNKVSTYSSGMLKKLSLLLSFAGEPGLILLDEPLITLDVRSVDILREMISQHAVKGVSFLLSSHQEPELNDPCQRLHIHGKTIQTETNVAAAE